MGLVINFFRDRKIERIDYADVILFFEKELKCQTKYGEEEVALIYHEDIFDYDYAFLITKRSHVENLALLNPEYVNIRFLIELPALLPEQAVRQIYSIIDVVCHEFSLSVQFNGMSDICEIDFLKLMKSLDQEREKWFKNHPDKVAYEISSNYLTHLANFHQSFGFLQAELGDVVLNRYQLLTNNNDHEVSLALKWEKGTPTVFPPHLDYIIVVENDLPEYIKADVFFKKIKRLLTPLDDFIPNVHLNYINKKCAQKAQRKINHLAKAFEHDLVFSNILIDSVVEK